MECCIKQFWCSSIISYNITSIAYKRHTDIYPILNVYIYMQVLEAYALCGGRDCLVANASALQGVLAGLLCQVAPSSVQYVVRPIEAFFLACPADTANFLAQSGLLLPIVRACAADVPHWKEALKEYSEPKVSLVSYLSIVARLLLVPEGVSALAQAAEALAMEVPPAVCTAIGLNGPSIVTSLARLLIDNFDAAGYRSTGPWYRKLWCLALLSLFPSHPQFYEWFPEVIHIATDVVTEEGTPEGKERALRMVPAMLSAGCMDSYANVDVTDDGADGGVEKEKEDPLVGRFRLMLVADVVLAMSCEAAAKEKHEQTRLALGEEQFRLLMKF